MLHEKVQRLVESFREQLRGVLEVNCSLYLFTRQQQSTVTFCGFVFSLAHRSVALLQGGLRLYTDQGMYGYLRAM